MSWQDVPCKIAPGKPSASGYGRCRRGGKVRRAHRVAWEDHHGPIPPGLYVLHHCDNPPCIEITHLWLGTAQDNARDRDIKRRGNNSRKTHCPEGHELAGANLDPTRLASGRRICLICSRAKALAYYHAHKVAA